MADGDISLESIGIKQPEVSREAIRETTRSTIAMTFLYGYLALILLLLLLATFAKLPMDMVKDFLLALGGPFGFVIGFYFTSERE